MTGDSDAVPGEAMRAKCKAIALGWADLDCRPVANAMAIQIANAIASISPPSASEHEWWTWKRMECCKKCGIVKRADGHNNPCKGTVKVGHRSPPSASEQSDDAA